MTFFKFFPALAITLAVAVILVTRPDEGSNGDYLLIDRDLGLQPAQLERRAKVPGEDTALAVMDPALLPAVFSQASGDMEASIPARHFSLSVGAAGQGLDAEAKPIFTAWKGRVRSGESLIGLLTEQGVSQAEAAAAAKAMDAVFDSHKLKAGQSIELSLVPSLEKHPGEAYNKLISVTVSPSAMADYMVIRDKEGFSASSIERPVTRRLVYREGVINGSFFGSGKRTGVPYKSLATLVKGFSYDVDFQRDLKAGDRFEVAYETYVNDEGEVAYDGEVVFGALILSGKRKEIYRFTPASGRKDFFNGKGESVKKALLRTPVDGARISSRFGMRKHPILGYSKMHRGIDFAAARGTPIYAAGDGTVEVAKWNGGYGRYIRIKHGKGYATAYAHMTRFAKDMRRGKRVKQGQVIGYVGTTGRSTGPHLHYEVLKDGRQVNPLSIKLLPGEKLKGRDIANFKTIKEQVNQARRQRGQIFLANRKER
ncbi:MAG: M23 family metallopeptidase [Rhodospirillales bacterium]|nr:M23 family metallopeptidase [Rhodospirillales bacterium]